jgi:hypothetical protein
MNKTKILLAVAMAAVTSTIASAKLGDTVAQSNARYHRQGVRFDTTTYGGPSSMIWLVGDWNIEEWFDDGVCTIIQYGRRDNGWLTDEELNTLLANNGGSDRWVKEAKTLNGTDWTNAADAICAKYFSCPMVPVKGTGRGVNAPVMRFGTIKALSARGLILEDGSDADQPLDSGKSAPSTLQSI